MKSLSIAALIVAATVAQADDAKKLSASDLAVQTHKYDGKLVEARLRCFYADKDEFRCVADNGTRVDFSKIEPPAIRARVEDKCDTVRSILKKECIFDVQFTYQSFDTAETGGLGQQHLVIAKDNAGKFR